MAKALTEKGLDQMSIVAQLSNGSGKSKKMVKLALSLGEQHWKKALEAQGYKENGHLKHSEAQLPRYLRQKNNLRCVRGCYRAGGAGRKSCLSFLYPGVKSWLETMRCYGHWCIKPDLVAEYEELGREWLKSVERKEAKEALSLLEAARKDAVSRKLEKLKVMAKNREKFAGVLQKYCGARFWKPQRIVQLTMDEEAQRAEQIWRSYDSALHAVAFGNDKEYEQMFAKPAQARENVKNTVLIYSDEVPFWIKTRGSSELGPSMYDQHEEMHDLWSGAEDDSEYESHGAMDEDHSADQMSSIVRMGI